MFSEEARYVSYHGSTVAQPAIPATQYAEVGRRGLGVRMKISLEEGASLVSSWRSRMGDKMHLCLDSYQSGIERLK